MSYIIVLMMTLLSAFASYNLKLSSINKSITSLIRSKYLYFGGFLYIVSSILNVWVLRLLPYSIVVPMGGICYIWTMLISRKKLHERVNSKKILGTVLIIFGVTLISL